MRPPEFFRTAPLDQLRVLRKPETLALVGLSATRVRYLEATGDFPARIALGDNAVGWLEHEVREWLAQRATRTAVKPLGARAAAAAPTPAKTAGKTAAGPVAPRKANARKGG